MNRTKRWDVGTIDKRQQSSSHQTLVVGIDWPVSEASDTWMNPTRVHTHVHTQQKTHVHTQQKKTHSSPQTYVPELQDSGR